MLNRETIKDILQDLEHVRLEISSIENRIIKELKQEEDLQPFNSIFNGKTALIGNYDECSANELKKILQLFGMRVEIVQTGIEILDKMKRHCNYDVIFTNHIYQVGFRGEKLLEELRKIEGFNTPVIIHTIDRNMRFHYINTVGFDEYIEKPISFSNFDKIVEIKEKLEKFFN